MANIEFTSFTKNFKITKMILVFGTEYQFLYFGLVIFYILVLGPDTSHGLDVTKFLPNFIFTHYSYRAVDKAGFYRYLIIEMIIDN